MEKIESVAGCCCVYNDFSFLEYVADNIMPFMKKIFFFVSHSMYDGTAKEGDNKLTLKVIDRLKKKYGEQIVLVRKDWKNQIIQRNEAIKTINDAGFQYCFIFDADEFYSAGDMQGILHYGLKMPHIDTFNTHFYTYFKKVNYRIEPLQRLKALSLIKSTVNLSKTRGVNQSIYSNLLIPQEHVCWHHLSHVRNDEQMLEKFKIAKHEYGLNIDWYYNVWLKWFPEMKNFHPNEPASFSSVIDLKKDQLPDFLQRFYNNDEFYLNGEMLSD